MAQLVVNGAMLACTAGSVPMPLTVIPTNQVFSPSGNPAANIQDAKPFVNIKPFGTCQILTSAASGTPTPCAPATAVWAPGSPTVLIRGNPALNNTSKCMCGVGGVVQITMPGQVQVKVP